ncbi:hypothetical protein PAUR_a1578 [Pseudoalteromonas aurantia 208]|uniref:Orphan protein n=1 Tax=Pseudoalteromonas aurantia 208 TaxID=1314867 RepID=A0ABR9EAR3_9GAMM|nr:hypothetical protein [Pseudoalteromonas aurantia 208]
MRFFVTRFIVVFNIKGCISQSGNKNGISIALRYNTAQKLT